MQEERISRKSCFRMLEEAMKKANINDGFFALCQEYYWYYQMYDQLKPVIPVLKNYMDKEEHLSKASQIKQREAKSAGKPTSRKVNLELEEHLYAGFFTKIYLENYSNKYSFGKVIDKSESISQILQERFQNIDKELTRQIVHSVMEAYENTYRKIDLEKMHRAMKKYKDVRENTLYPDKEDSVRHVLAESQLIKLKECLNLKDEKMGKVLYSFHRASISKELRDGAYYKYTQYSGKEDFYFNIPCQYNLKELKLYIDGGDRNDIYGLRGLYERYVDVMKELSMLEQQV